MNLAKKRNQSYLKTSISHTERNVNESTGEILSEEVKNYKYLAETNEEFFLVYTSMIAIMEKGMSAAESSLYATLLRSYQTGVDICITKGMRLNLGEKLKLNERTIQNTLGMLAERKLLFTTSKGIYQINPRYAYKGSTHNRNKELKAVLELWCPDC